MPGRALPVILLARFDRAPVPVAGPAQGGAGGQAGAQLGELLALVLGRLDQREGRLHHGVGLVGDEHGGVTDRLDEAHRGLGDL